MKESRFTTRDLAFIGMTIALMYIVQTITILGISAITPVDAAKSIVSAFFVSIVIAIGLAKVGKIGTFTIIGIINGIICGFILPAFLPLLPTTILGGVAADGITKALYGQYGSRNSLVTACGVNQLVMTVTILIIPILFGFSTMILSPALIAVSALLCAGLGAAGGLVGSKIVDELKKAGAITD
ncbi:MAG: MptD family putative ECF transporter S component [Methanomicrobiales archaeon]